MNLNNKKSNIFIILFSIIVCFVLVGMSPIYDFYYFLHDASVYYVIGRGMKEGLVPYVDLFDHKGLYIYFINMLGSLISYRHIGMYLISVIFTATFGIYINKLLCLYNKKHLVNLVVSLVMVVISRFSYFSNNTQNPEQYILTFEMMGIYIFVQHIIKNENKFLYYGIIEGILCGIVFFMKFNYVLIWVVLYGLSVYFVEKKNIIKITIGAIVGFLIAITPVIIYCIITKSFYDMIDAYFILNINYASHGFAKYENLSKGNLLIRTMEKYSIVFLITILASIVNIHILKKNNLKKELVTYLGLLFTIIVVVISPLTGLNYYSIVLIIFFIPTIFFLCCKIFDSKDKVFIGIRGLLVAVVLIISMYFFGYKDMVNDITKKDNQESKEMARIIKNAKKKNKKTSILFVGYCTYVYNEADIFPSSKYFYIPIVRYEDKSEIFETIKKEVLTNKHNVVLMGYDQEFIRNVFGNELYDHLNKKYDVVLSLGNKFIYRRKW